MLFPPSRIPIKGVQFPKCQETYKKGVKRSRPQSKYGKHPDTASSKYHASGFPIPRRARHLPCIPIKISVQVQVLYPPYIPVGTPTRTPIRSIFLASMLLASRYLNKSCILARLVASTLTPTQMQDRKSVV